MTATTFCKAEKLCGKTSIDRLFASKDSKSFVKYPLRYVYRLTSVRNANESQCRMLVSVGKRRFKRAVLRNRVKRLVREAYRLQKAQLLGVVGNSEQMKGKSIHLAVIFVGNELPSYEQVFASVAVAVRKLSEFIEVLGVEELRAESNDY